ncbi:MAG: hypothetical protein LBU23_09680 [Planctomycetota bacterium]|nr:hypothetical protein [Planctomycetota bacterium]
MIKRRLAGGVLMAVGKKLADVAPAAAALVSVLAGLAPAFPSLFAGDGLPPPAKSAELRIGGEMRIDYSYRRARAPTAGGRLEAADLALRVARLRLGVDVHPNVSALFKINLQDSPKGPPAGSEIMEEAMVALRAAGGGDWSFYAGQGRAPYGQDIALGIIQSYHHSANRGDSADGPLFIAEPPGVAAVDPATGARTTIPARRPGQLERVFLAGTAYEWDSRWRMELAVFQPEAEEYAPRLTNRKAGALAGAGSDIGFAARWWGRPVEALTLEASAVMEHSGDMGRPRLRTDLPGGAKAAENAFALSLGFDWRLEPWRVFGEYQHGWDWDFIRGHAADAWQLGLARSLGRGWRVGGMAEALRLDYGDQHDSFYKLALNVRYAAAAGWFVLAEYGHEWLTSRRDGRTDNGAGDFIGLRIGLTF